MKSFAVLLIGLFITMGFAQAQTQDKPAGSKENKSATCAKHQPEASQSQNAHGTPGHQCNGNHQHGTAPAEAKTNDKPCDKPCDKSKVQSADKSQSKNKSKDKKAACCHQHSEQKTSK